MGKLYGNHVETVYTATEILRLKQMEQHDDWSDWYGDYAVGYYVNDVGEWYSWRAGAYLIPDEEDDSWTRDSANIVVERLDSPPSAEALTNCWCEDVADANPEEGECADDVIIEAVPGPDQADVRVDAAGLKRTLTQTATKTITLSREIVVEFPVGVDPDAVDPQALASALADADVEWEVDDEEFEIDGGTWDDANDGTEPDVVYEGTS